MCVCVCVFVRACVRACVRVFPVRIIHVRSDFKHSLEPSTKQVTRCCAGKKGSHCKRLMTLCATQLSFRDSANSNDASYTTAVFKIVRRKECGRMT